MSTVRLGIIGLGNMGAPHARNVLAGKAGAFTLAAIADANPAALTPFPEARHFASGEELIASGCVDAVLIATPHYSHTTLGIAALQAGLHVLVEKPISVHAADCQRLIAAHQRPGQVFAAMFNQRTVPAHRKIRELIATGALGPIRRAHWTITNWFRTDAYYASGGWRATWAGEGGGVLLNQAPHNLDLLWWFLGRPARIRAHCHFGKHHAIEVEDDVTAYLEFAHGATATFVTSTGEAPGANRLEISGDLGRLVFEHGKLHLQQNRVATAEFCRTAKGGFDRPEVIASDLLVESPPASQHAAIMENFAAAILHGAPLIAPAAEGLFSVELANAMLLSTWLDRTIDLPLDAALYEAELKKRIDTSRRTLAVQTPAAPSDLAKSFNT